MIIAHIRGLFIFLFYAHDLLESDVRPYVAFLSFCLLWRSTAEVLQMSPLAYWRRCITLVQLFFKKVEISKQVCYNQYTVNFCEKKHEAETDMAPTSCFLRCTKYLPSEAEGKRKTFFRQLTEFCSVIIKTWKGRRPAMKKLLSILLILALNKNQRLKGNLSCEKGY